MQLRGVVHVVDVGRMEDIPSDDGLKCGKSGVVVDDRLIHAEGEVPPENRVVNISHVGVQIKLHVYASGRRTTAGMKCALAGAKRRESVKYIQLLDPP